MMIPGAALQAGQGSAQGALTVMLEHIEHGPVGAPEPLSCVDHTIPLH